MTGPLRASILEQTGAVVSNRDGASEGIDTCQTGALVSNKGRGL